ncbi:MAG TPA: hypothetical protein VN706_09770 [Gemmatimonadaceae bacterium]|nr:hypothetical protein [Gemmatimonadaceae bacterium]
MKRVAIGIACVASTLGIIACVPRLSPLEGEARPAARLPKPALSGHQHIMFNWELQDREMLGRGDGAARLAAPDSGRLDFFLAGGFGGGAAVLIGDSLRFPASAMTDLVSRIVPPPPLLWAALGRVALPNLPDTVIRVEGTTMRADVGSPVAWRLTFHGDTLVRAERVVDGRVVEWVDRTDPAHVRYRNESARRSLTLTVTRTSEVPGFDASIWRFDR